MWITESRAPSPREKIAGGCAPWPFADPIMKPEDLSPLNLDSGNGYCTSCGTRRVG